MARADTVAVVGATGVTGGYAFDEAERRGLRPVAVGRNPAKLETFLRARGLPADRLRVADVCDDGQLERALTDVAVVVSTVAPYGALGFPVARAAARLGLGYTDAAGECAFIHRVVCELDQLATRTGATLAPGNGVAAFTGDIAMHWITDRRADSSGTVLYDVKGYKPSAGTFESYIKHILPGGGSAIRDGRVEFHPLATFAGSAAGIAGIHGVLPDALVISRYWPARHLDGLFRCPAAARPAIRVIGATLTRPRIGNAVLKAAGPLAYRTGTKDRSTLTALAEHRSSSGHVRTRKLRCRGIYPTTGVTLVATAQAMLRRDPRPAGVRAASELFASFEEAMTLTGIEHVADEHEEKR